VLYYKRKILSIGSEVMLQEVQEFDLNNELPNVLLLGNGILMHCQTCNYKRAKSWSEYIVDLSSNGLTIQEQDKLRDIPYSLCAALVAPVEDHIRGDKYVEKFQTQHYQNDKVIREIVTLPFQAILTTNYTYEIENVFYSHYDKLGDKTKCKYARCARKNVKDGRFLLHTFNRVGESPPIWHIHGELRRPSSMVLNHDEYARLIHHLMKENELNENKYVKYEKSLRYESWLDYFLMSNLYIVGLGMDFSEFDLWWILNRRIREKRKNGKIVYCKSHYDDSHVADALKMMGVKVQEFNISAYNKEEYYNEFYEKAIQYLKDERTEKNEKKIK
jgi:hypothetical protein